MAKEAFVANRVIRNTNNVIRKPSREKAERMFDDLLEQNKGLLQRMAHETAEGRKQAEDNLRRIINEGRNRK